MRRSKTGENGYVTALNTNPSLAYCSSSTNGSGTCGNAINYAEWNKVVGSAACNTGLQYYSFGNPQPTFDPTTHALTNLAVEVVGAAQDPQSPTGWIFAHKVLNLAPKNGFLNNVWWSNFESYSQRVTTRVARTTGSTELLRRGQQDNDHSCNPVYFAPGDYLSVLPSPTTRYS